MNEKLGLPFDNMRKVTIAIDVDGTLINSEDKPNREIMDLVYILGRMKNTRIVVWSGGGKEYAEMWVRRLGIEKYVWKCASKTEWKEINADVAVDDIQDTAIGRINLIVRNK